MNQQVPDAPAAVVAGSRAKVFVSYSRMDVAFAQMLVRALAERGFDAFLDKTDIAPGEPWKERLAGLIATADTIVFVVSPDSVVSTTCAWELEESARLGKRILPVVARRIAAADAPPAVGRLNWVFLTEGDDKDAALAALNAALQTDLAWVREHTRLGELARHWDEQGRGNGATLRGADLEAAERWLDRRPADANTPTGLHQDFIRASRRAATARQRYWVGGSIAVAVVAIGLAGFAEISRRQAETQRQRAEENLQTTQRLLVQFSDLVAERIRPIASLDEVDSLLAQATNLIGSAQRGDPGIAVPYAEMLLTQAETKWERRRTQEMYGLANAAIAALTQSDKGKSEVQHLLARANGLIGLYFAAPASPEADQEKARDYYKIALALLEPLDKKFDQSKGVDVDWRWLRSLAGLQEGMGDLLLNQFRNVDEAKENYQQSIQTWAKLKGVRPDDPEVTYELGWVEDKLGDVFWGQGQDSLALRQFEKAEKAIKPLLDRFDVDQKWLHFLAIVQDNIGVNRSAHEQYKQAIDAFQQAEANLKRLLSHDPEQSNWRSALAWTYDNIGEAKVRWARKTRDASVLEGAEVELETSADLRAQLAQRTDNQRWKIEPAISRADIAAYEGTKKELARDCSDAADDFTRAAEINPSTVTDEREDVMVLRKAEFLEWAGLDYRNAGNNTDAEEKLSEALTIIKNYVPKFPGRSESFVSMKQRLEQELQERAPPAQGVCN
jgi:tetratricopeptide (TPR) repeat protein